MPHSWCGILLNKRCLYTGSRNSSRSMKIITNSNSTYLSAILWQWSCGIIINIENFSACDLRNGTDVCFLRPHILCTHRARGCRILHTACLCGFVFARRRTFPRIFAGRKKAKVKSNGRVAKVCLIYSLYYINMHIVLNTGSRDRLDCRVAFPDRRGYGENWLHDLGLEWLSFQIWLIDDGGVPCILFVFVQILMQTRRQHDIPPRLEVAEVDVQHVPNQHRQERYQNPPFEVGVGRSCDHSRQPEESRCQWRCERAEIRDKIRAVGVHEKIRSDAEGGHVAEGENGDP